MQMLPPQLKIYQKIPIPDLPVSASVSWTHLVYLYLQYIAHNPYLLWLLRWKNWPKNFDAYFSTEVASKSLCTIQNIFSIIVLSVSENTREMHIFCIKRILPNTIVSNCHMNLVCRWFFLTKSCPSASLIQ